MLFHPANSLHYIYTARSEAIANAANPNLRSQRMIPKVLPEAKSRFQPKGTNVTPPPTLRLYELIKYLKYMNGITQVLSDKDVQNSYLDLKEIARGVVKDMVKEEKKKSLDVSTMSWSQLGKIDTSIQERYALLLEKRALDVGYDLHLCVEMWAAKLLLSEVLKNKKTVDKRNSSTEGSNDEDQRQDDFNPTGQTGYDESSFR